MTDCHPPGFEWFQLMHHTTLPQQPNQHARNANHPGYRRCGWDIRGLTFTLNMGQKRIVSQGKVSIQSRERLEDRWFYLQLICIDLQKSIDRHESPCRQK